MESKDLYEQRKNLFYQASSLQRGFLIFCCLLGLSAFFVGIASGQATRAWGSFLFNLMFFFSIALAGVAFGGMQDIIGAKWGRPVKRLHESFSAFLPYAAIAFFLFFFCIRFKLLGAHEVYSWIHDPHVIHGFYGKDVWLQRDFMLARNVVSLLIILALAKWHMDQTIKGDMSLLRGDKQEARKLAKEAEEKLRYWSAPVLVVHSLCFSLICFDLTMSLAPTWFSTLWAGWCFAIAMQCLFAILLLFMFSLRSSKIGAFIARDQFHDIGKLLHGFTVFFAYLTFAHVLTYWYTNIPEETSYFITRLEAPWIYLVIVSPFLFFVFPFFTLIPKVSKWTFGITVPVAIVVLVSQWINYLLVVIPEVTKPENWSFPWLEIGGFVGFLGLFLFSLALFAKKVPLLNISDPLLEESLSQKH